MTKSAPRHIRCFWLTVLLLSAVAASYAGNGAGVVHGTVTDSATAAPLVDCVIRVPALGRGTVTDSLGRFALTLPYGRHKLEFSHVGFVFSFHRITISASNPQVPLAVALLPKVLLLPERTVMDDPAIAPPTVQRIDQADVRLMPKIYGEFLRSLPAFLPGISANNELSSAYNVRGGNFNENIISLNGYEIFRPFLLRQGVEENQSLINPDMVEGIRFYGGAFPAKFGDRMSSVLEVDYVRDQPANWGGVLRADLLTQGVNVHEGAGRLKWSLGARYANPSSFVRRLQTRGNYRPQFQDIQFLASHILPARSQVELFYVDAENTFRTAPKNWRGNFVGENFLDVKEVEIRSSGERNYSFRTGLVGLRLAKTFTPKNHISISAARYHTTEKEDADLRDSIYYNDNPVNPDSPLWYLKTRLENDHNHLDLTTYAIQPSVQFSRGVHTVQVGADVRFVDLDSRVDEFMEEEGDSSAQEVPRVRWQSQKLKLNSTSGYVEDAVAIRPYLLADLGLRLLHYDYNRETLLSPRMSVHYDFTASDLISLSWGYYYQPPFFYELRADTGAGGPRLKSQRAIHYILGWQHEFDADLRFEVEGYYKQLDRLIPFDLDQMKLEYSDRNSNTGYAYGLDVLLRGPVTEAVKSWISYGYLHTREEDPASGRGHVRRLLDQTHTLRFFLQDRMPGHSNIQSHQRILLGSGYLYHPLKVVADADGHKIMVVDENRNETYPIYFRADWGFSVQQKLGKGAEMIVMAEVLNVFNRANVASFSWFPIFPDDREPVKVPNVLSARFFNAGIELRFN